MVNTYAVQSGGCRFESLWGFGFFLKGAHYEVDYSGKKTYLAGLQCTLTSSCAIAELYKIRTKKCKRSTLIRCELHRRTNCCQTISTKSQQNSGGMFSLFLFLTENNKIEGKTVTYHEVIHGELETETQKTVD